MTALSRRSFLKQAPIAAVVAGTPINMAVAEIRAEPSEDSDMKCMRLARELFNAMKAHYGDGCKMIRNEDTGAVFFLPPPPPVRIVEFDGPAWYEVEDGSPDRVKVMWLNVDNRFPPHPRNGRFFKATPKDNGLHSRHYEESWLRQIIVRKIGSVVL